MTQVPWMQAFARAKGYAVIAVQSNVSTNFDASDLDANLASVLSAWEVIATNPVSINSRRFLRLRVI